MGIGQDLSDARWRKSSYSGDTGGQGVECASRSRRRPSPRSCWA
ncbi:DUF397 domain-containing protein [Streptomyces sp. ME02-8801-2C]